MKLLIRSCFSLIIIFTLILTPWSFAFAAPKNQTVSPLEKAKALLVHLKPEERVGQLFLAVFKGTEVGDGTPIQNLIANYHIGGVILLAANDNISTGDEALGRLLLMNRELQLNKWSASQKSVPIPRNGETFSPQFIPLLIGISQEGDGYPNDQILYGLTPLPNEMALGATWDPQAATKVGTILGNELSALGINLLLGPALDVLETPRSEGTVDLSIRTFGSDPFWVSLMGSAYIQGIHAGSQNQIAVAAKHFPGNGGSDRSPEEEVATVRKSLEQLKNFDLLPFFAVTGNALSPEATSDALLASHIRYQGFQENIRATTRPVSFDPQAFSLLLHLPALSTWRDNGGVVICDNLGSQAVRRFYELTGQSYDARRVTLNAFLAGNDLLYLGDITSGDDPDAYTTTGRVLEFFAQKYREDPAFAQQVDESVLRILTLKYKLYPEFNIDSILPSSERIDQIGQSTQVTFDIARQAATLISPSSAQLYDAMPDPPKLSERITFISDVRMAQQCSQCPPQPLLSVDAFEQAVKRLYGQQAGGQIWPANLSSFSFGDLLMMLDKNPEAPPIENTIKRSEWVIFAMLNVTQDVPSSSALKRFLSERSDLIQQKRILVFAFNAPYYLDATNISKLTAYYGMYSKNPIFIEVASRILFKELLANGALPVSVPGVSYDIITATSPNPDQIIPLILDIPQPTNPITPTITTPEPTAIPKFQINTLLPIKTGVILDHNGHPVPDGTPVQFITSVGGATIFPQSETTKAGIAHTAIKIDSSGSWEIRVESEPAKQSEILRFEVPAIPGEMATATPTETPTQTPTQTQTPTVSVASTEETSPKPPQHPYILDWLIALVVSITVGYSSYQVASTMGHVRWGLRAALLSLIGGLFGYCYLALKLPGSTTILTKLATWGVILIALLGSTFGVLAAWGWRTYRTEKPGSD